MHHSNCQKFGHGFDVQIKSQMNSSSKILQQLSLCLFVKIKRQGPASGNGEVWLQGPAVAIFSWSNNLAFLPNYYDKCNTKINVNYIFAVYRMCHD